GHGAEAAGSEVPIEMLRGRLRRFRREGLREQLEPVHDRRVLHRLPVGEPLLLRPRPPVAIDLAVQGRAQAGRQEASARPARPCDQSCGPPRPDVRLLASPFVPLLAAMVSITPTDSAILVRTPFADIVT